MLSPQNKDLNSGLSDLEKHALESAFVRLKEELAREEKQKALIKNIAFKSSQKAKWKMYKFVAKMMLKVWWSKFKSAFSK